RDDGSREPVDPEGFVAGIAERVNALVADPTWAADLGRSGRRRAVEEFSWPSIAEQTLDLYHSLL
ncbi:MAG TPA: glycosyltransferase, partial [Gaiellaceae bacterium]|nr:glycosyltransferase [Gaiellaceae bacterium]